MAGVLDGKVAYITGGSRGIGAETARLLSSRGAAIVIGYGDKADRAEELAEELRAGGGRAEISGGDVRDKATSEAGVAKALEAFGKLDILVTVAGISARETLAEITAERFREVYDVNVLGTLWAIQAAAPHLTSPGGKVVTVSSRMALNPIAESSLYSGAKAAVIAMTESYAKDLGPRGITVNSVAPGLIETEMTTKSIAERGAAVAAATPLKRVGQPIDVAGVIAFFCSDDSRWVTGRTLRADGGIV